jgi:hypothetical protein
MSTELAHSEPAPQIRLAIRILAFVATALLVPAINLGALVLGWAVFLEDKGRSGIRTAVIWTVVALAVNYVLWGLIIGTRF